MTKLAATLAISVCASLVHAQGGRGGADWTTAGSDAHRSFWVRSDPKINPTSMQKPGFQFLWKVKLASSPAPPVLLDRYIGYRGFRSLAFAGSSSNQMFALDTDLGRIEWQKQLPGGSAPAGSAACSGGMTAGLTRPTPTAFPAAAPGGGGAGGGRRGGPARSGAGEPGQGAVTLANVNTAGRGAPPGFPDPAAGRRGGGGGGRMPNFVHALSSDGMFHTMYVSNGDEPEPAVRFLPANANAQGLILVDNVAYAATSGGCGGVPDAVWALDLASKQVTSWKPGAGGIAGSAGPAFGPDGTLYVTTTGGELVALEPKTLKAKGSYSTGKVEFTSSPVVFEHKEKALIAAATKDGRIHLVDGVSLAKAAESATVAGLAPATLASWRDPAGARWLLAPSGRAIMAWKVTDQGGVPSLQQGWVSREMASPGTPAIVNGVVFAVAASPRAVLYALDSATGKELWNSGSTITAAVRGGGLSAGSSQMYLGASDGTLYAFGFPIEH